jgi:hypothetical protein
VKWISVAVSLSAALIARLTSKPFASVLYGILAKSTTGNFTQAMSLLFLQMMEITNPLIRRYRK